MFGRNSLQRSRACKALERFFTVPNSDSRISISTSSSGLKQKEGNYSPTYYYNMDGKHLAQGSMCPPLTSGKVRIYSMRFCPFAQRAILVALAKGIPHDVVNCNLKDKPNWLFKRNPLGKVPVLELSNGKILYESLTVADYLDEAYDGRPLQEQDPLKKALDRVWVERFSGVIALFYKSLRAMKNEDKVAFQTHFQTLSKGLQNLDEELLNRKTKFFGGGNYPGMLDYMIWPWIERFPVFKSIVPSGYIPHLENLPNLNRWEEDMRKDDAVKEFLLPLGIHEEFIQTLLDGSPNYNILDAKL